MPKFFLSTDSVSGKKIGDVIEITSNDAHHISKTLRMKQGEKITVTDSASVDYFCVIDSFTSESVYLKICDIKKSDVEDYTKVSLFQALIKGDKMETVIQKCVELGVYEIYPVMAERSVMKLDKQNEQKKLERWNKIAFEASKQCGRGLVPVVHGVIDFKTCVDKLSSYDAGFFCYELENQKTPKSIIRDKSVNSIGFYIGPEGGISPTEAETAFRHGIEAVSLGKLILRTETAGPAVMSMILYETRL